MAARSLSPKREVERLRQFRHAVIVIARQRAKRAVQDHIRARGLKVAQFSAREIAELAESYMAQQMEELIAKATQDCLAMPEFAGCAELLSDAQTQNPQASMASAVRMLGAE